MTTKDEIHRTDAMLLSSYAPGWTAEMISAETWMWQRDLDLDSVALIDVVCACEERFDVPIPARLLAAHQLTIGTLTRQIEELTVEASS